MLCSIRQLFSDGRSCDRATALRQLAQALGHQRLGPRIRKALSTVLRTAVRRRILQNEGGKLALKHRTIEEYDRNFLKAQFLASLARTWTSRDAATAAFARWLGFARTGPIITDTTRSLIRGLLREGRIESDGIKIRKVH